MLAHNIIKWKEINLTDEYELLKVSDTHVEIYKKGDASKGTNDKKWAKKYYPQIKDWIDSQMKRDRNNNGLVEYEISGNSGCWDGKTRPANWWDTIGFGHEDAFSNAITYDALKLMVMAAKILNKKDDAELYNQYAEKLKNSYFKTFYNPKTEILAGWKSKDGILSGINAGEFQGYCATEGMTKDWKSWKGDCWGEGFLCDCYLVLLAFNPEDK